MPPITMHLSLDGLKDLENDIMEFAVDEGPRMSKAAKDYLKTMREAIKRTLSHMPPGGSIAFSSPEAGEGAEVASKWLQGWKDRSRGERDANQSQSMPASSHGREGSPSRKRGRDATVLEPAVTRPKPSNHRLINFHVQLLLDLLQDHPEVAEAVLLLQDSLTILHAGAKSHIFQWHLKRVKGMLPDNADISEAIDMLSECISYKDKL